MSQDSHQSVSLAYASAYDYNDVPPSRSASVAGHYPKQQQQQQQPQQHPQQSQQQLSTPSGSPYQGYYRSPSQAGGGGSVGSSGAQQYSHDPRQNYMYSPQQAPVRYVHDQGPNARQPSRTYTQPQQSQESMMYRQSNVSMPALDAGNAPGASRAPPLADDLGDSFANMRLLGTPNLGPQRSKSPAPPGAARNLMGAASVRANTVYANQEIHQSAAEVHPDNSLAAIANEIDQAAADLDQGNRASANGHDTSVSYSQLGDTSSVSAADWQAQQHGAYANQYGGGMRHNSAPGESYPLGSFDASVEGHDQQHQQYPQGGQQGQGSYDAASGYFGGQHGGGSGNGGFPPGAHPGYQPHQGNGYAFAQQSYAGANGFETNAYYAAAQGYIGYPEGTQPSYPPGMGGAGAAMGMGMGVGAAQPGMLTRQGTQMSMSSMAGGGSSSSRRKSKDVVPQQTLPFNKAFVAEYRQRMKGDPDPEAQFAFAKYLIEAAKKVQDPADGPKQQRKYRDTLLAESLKLIKRLATTGMGIGKPPYAEAQFFLANCFGNGSLGLQVDHEKAYNLYVQASKQNHPAATYRTAVCNEVGAGTRRDHHRAVLFYRKASALGDTAGMYKLGMVLLNGLLGQPRNIREAVVWLKRAAAQADEDNPHALHELGLLHEKPNSTVVVHDEAYARELFTQAAQLGYAPSQFKLGCAYEYGSLTCPVDPRRSIAWYTKAAGKGDGESELALSGWYLTGSEGVLKQSDSEAYLWARRAATKGIAKAEYAVGYYSEVGIGVAADIDEAKRWYMRAAAQGNKRAMQRLTELKKQKGQAGKKGARPTRKDAESECVII
ncbi:hypothetical protein ACQY0O_006094 [Thecaphora frezii]